MLFPENMVTVVGRPRDSFANITRTDDGRISIRLDCDRDPEFWMEVRIHPDVLTVISDPKWEPDRPVWNGQCRPGPT